eukprot:g57520.t1
MPSSEKLYRHQWIGNITKAVSTPTSVYREYHKTCIDTNECASGLCDGQRGNCTNKEGSYTCQCNVGWVESTNKAAQCNPSCVKLDCGQDAGTGSCLISPDNEYAACLCNDGYWGDECSLRVADTGYLYQCASPFLVKWQQNFTLSPHGAFVCVANAPSKGACSSPLVYVDGTCTLPVVYNASDCKTPLVWRNTSSGIETCLAPEPLKIQCAPQGCGVAPEKKGVNKKAAAAVIIVLLLLGAAAAFWCWVKKRRNKQLSSVQPLKDDQDIPEMVDDQQAVELDSGAEREISGAEREIKAPSPVAVKSDDEADDSYMFVNDKASDEPASGGSQRGAPKGAQGAIHTPGAIMDGDDEL